MSGAAIAQAAQMLLGTPFRLHGRDPELGVDCVGLVAAALDRARINAPTPSRYALRNVAIDDALGFAARAGLVEAGGPIRPGDIVLAKPGPAQQHLLIAVDGPSFIHAHAGLRRVVSTPAPLPWPILRHWRFEGSC